MPLELDHIFCMVDDLDQAPGSLERAGWVLDRGSVDEGQGTRNQRLAWPEQHLEMLCVVDDDEARSSPLRLDRRAEWTSTNASPFGFGLRGVLPHAYRDDFWLYEELGARIWMHRDNERSPTRPLVFVLEMPEEPMEQRRPPVHPSRPARALSRRHAVRRAHQWSVAVAVAGDAAAIRRTVDHAHERTAPPRAPRRPARLSPAAHPDPDDWR